MGDTTYTNYHKRLKGEKVPTHDGDPDCGFYRLPVRTSRENGNKITGWTQVCYFMHGTEMVGIIGDRDMTPNELTDLWTYVCAYPVPENVWRAVDAGAPWPRNLIGEPKQASRTAYPLDTGPALNRGLQGPPETADNPRAVVGNNQPPEAQLKPEDVLREEIANTIAANEIVKITSDEESAKVAATRNRLNEIKNKAEKEKEIEFRPHKDAADAVSKKWNAIIKVADDAAKKARSLLDDYATRKLQERRAEEARIAAENARIAEENQQIEQQNLRALDRAIEKGEAVSVDVLIPEKPLQEVTTPAPTAQVKANYGRAASVSVVRVATITDQALVYERYKDHADVKALLLKLAQADVTAGITVPGTKVTEEARTK